MTYLKLETLFLVFLLAAPAFARRLPDITVENSGWGQVSPGEVRAVFRSAAGEIWKHCANTRVDPILVYHRNDYPQTNWERNARGEIAIGIEAGNRRCAQLAFQFAHEFCHVLAGHSNDWRRAWRDTGKPNHWLEESLCETASLFTLRTMAHSWRRDAPFREWKYYAPEFEEYARERMSDSRRRAFPGPAFAPWLRRNEPSMRRNPNLREKNTVVAIQLLPLFEAEPRGWESVTFLNLGNRDRKMSLSRFLAEWRNNCPSRLRDFVTRLAASLGEQI